MSLRSAPGTWIPLAVGALLFVLGCARLIHAHRLSLSDVVPTFLAVIPAWLLLFLIAYVAQHSRLALIPLFAAGAVLLLSSPICDVVLGIALMGIVAVGTLSDRRCARALANGHADASGEVKKAQGEE